MSQIIFWDLYEIKSQETSLTGVMLRGRLRKLALSQHMNLLAENAEDEQNCVRFAVVSNQDVSEICKYISALGADINVKPILKNVRNPILSKLKVNDESRYQI